jgi:phage tail-like protein
MDISDFLGPGIAPPTAFYFSVKFRGEEAMDTAFQEVSGLKATLGVEGKLEGGEHLFVHRLPKTLTSSNLVLKRCLIPNSKLDQWCRDAFNNFKFDPKDIQIALMGPSEILASWNIVDAFPISWEVSSLNSTSNDLAIETLILNYSYFKKES